MKKVTLLDRMNGDVHLNFWATLEANGDFTLKGDNWGPADEDGDRDSYDWTVTVAAKYVPALAKLLGSIEGEDVIDTVTRKWLEAEGRGLEELIVDSELPSTLETYGVFPL
jgi:hypothetical protein